MKKKLFARTIDAGSSMLDELLASLKKSGKDTLEGKDIFKLYDTYGFPVELTEELAEDEGSRLTMKVSKLHERTTRTCAC